MATQPTFKVTGGTTDNLIIAEWQSLYGKFGHPFRGLTIAAGGSDTRANILCDGVVVASIYRQDTGAKPWKVDCGGRLLAFTTLEKAFVGAWVRDTPDIAEHRLAMERRREERGR